MLKPSGLSVYKKDNKIVLDYENCACGAFEQEIEINFCPVCGEDLQGDD